MYLGLIEHLLALLPSVRLMLGATHHDGLNADRNLVRACGAQKISHASLGHRREEDEDGEQGEQKVAGELRASHQSVLAACPSLTQPGPSKGGGRSADDDAPYL